MMFHPHKTHSRIRKLQSLALSVLVFLSLTVLVTPEAEAACDNLGPYPTGEPIELIACEDGGPSSNLQTYNLPVPAGAQGDLLVAVISVNSNNEIITMPAGWTSLAAQAGTGFSSNVFIKIYDSEPADYAVSWTQSNERSYGYMISLRGASGLYSTVTNNGSSLTPQAPSINTLIADSLILYTLAADRNRIIVSPDPANIASPHTGITQNNNGNGNRSVSGAGAYTYQATVGATPVANFSLTQTEGWYTRTIAFEPMQFNLALDQATTSVCTSSTQVTLRVEDSAGSPMDLFEGQVTITATGANAGTSVWTDPNSVVTSSASAVYTFDADDNGVAIFNYDNDSAGTVTFDISFDAFTSTTTPSLTINQCEFRIAFGSAPANEMGTCAAETITVTLADAVNGDQASNYPGGVFRINNNGADGIYSKASGDGSVSDIDNNDAFADITFASGESQIVLNYSDLTANTGVDFDIIEITGGIGGTGGAGGTAIVDSTNIAFDPTLDVVACEIWATVVDGSDQSDVCTSGAITFSIRTTGGTVVPGYDGNLIISTSSSQGDWSGGAGGLTNNGGGSASYNFVALTDLGVANLLLDHPFTGTVNFTVSGTAGNGAILGPSAGNVDTLTVVPCLVEVTVSSTTSDVCRDGQIVTYEIQDRNGVGPVVGYEGTILIQSKDDATGAIFKGDWEYDGSAVDPPTGAGQLNNAASDDGFASLTFVAADLGTIELRYINENLGDWDLDVGPTTFTLAGTSTADITVNPCQFFISYDDTTPEESDVCSIETITITLVDSVGNPITNADYVGSINISTSGAGGGSWTSPASLGNLGVFAAGPAESGIAVYEFVAGDSGEVTLEFTSLTSGTRNINASDGTTSDLGAVDAANDRSLDVALCTFNISYTDGADYDPASVSACSFQDVTIQIRDRYGAFATTYAGDIKVTVPLNKGDWSAVGVSDPPSGSGFLNGTADDGEMTYRFVAGDAGTVEFRFTSLEAGDYNFEIENVVGAAAPADIATGISGEIVEDSLRDPTLTITSCFPSVISSSCKGINGPVEGGNNQDTVDLTIPPVSALLDRMIIAIAAQEGSGSTPQTPTIGGVSMSLLHREVDGTDEGSVLEMWYLLEADGIPAGGSYKGIFQDAVENGNWGFCFLSLSEVAQVLPVYNAGDPAAGTLNYNDSNFDAVSELIETTITTSENNSLVVAATSSANAAPNWVFDNMSPEPPLARFGGDGFVANPGYGTVNEAQFAASAGVAPISASITYSESEDDYTASVNTQIVAAFEPRVPGPPVAVGYEPVKLFQTYSGTMSYRAIGNSLRPGQDACTFINNPGPTSAGTTTATLALPGPIGESTVTAAWLYWFGSGSAGLGTTGIDNQVQLIKGGVSSPDIDAVEMFIISKQITPTLTLDYFAGYADVTGIVTESDEYGITGLNIDFGTPWSTVAACAGGWAMIVVYENDFEQLRVLNLFQGFQPFQNSAFTLVPRNFRMASPSGSNPFDGNFPNGQITHVTVEGDFELATGDESLGIQLAPGSTAYTTLLTPFNPASSEFNSTITRPVYSLQPTSQGNKYLIDDGNPLTQANVIEEYEIDFPVDLTMPVGPPYYQALDAVGTSYGVDIDTHYVQGAVNGDTLFDFAAVSAEEITTRYSSGQDLVLLVSEVISVTNAALADIEIFKTGPAQATVDTTQSYTFTVTNNGDGTVAGGFANGEIIVTDILPDGMTFESIGTVNDDVTGTDWSCTETAVGVNPGAFTCIYNIASAYAGGELGIGESLPPITASVKIGDSSDFPAQTSNVTNVARVLHSGGSCTIGSPGVSPDPATCSLSPQFDNVNDLQGGTLDLNDLDVKTANNNNVSALTTEVRGIETDLSIAKSVVGVLEVGSAAQYTISVTNNGPDQTTTAFTLSDLVPAGLTFVSVDASTSADWNCTSTSPLSCVYSGSGLALGTPISVVLNVNVTGSAGQSVTNTATVTTAAGNFDPNNSNNTAVDITEIISPPAETTERFLLSVSEDNITLGGQLFGKDDLVLYNPDTDTATPFFIDADEAEIDVNDINAVHLLQNGQIVMSVNGASTADDIPGGFGPEDIVIWDPILKTTTLLFEGTGKFDEVENIDAVYILENGDIVFSTVDDGSWNSNAVEWDKSDLLRWDGNAVTKYLDGGDSTVFDEEDAAQVDAVYVRVADANANTVKNTFWLSASTDPLGGTVNAGTNSGAFGNAFGQDDLLELADPKSEITPGAVSSTGNLLFSGSTPFGVFTGANSANNRIDGVHIVEDGYHGHFSIVEDQGGTTCAPGRIRISKHLGLSHLVDAGYTGSITIGSSTGVGGWSINTGSGTLNNEPSGIGTDNDGNATYTFVPADTGTVVLNFTTGTPGFPQTFDVNVSNTIVSELNAEDETFNFFDEITSVSFLDTFQTVSYARNDGLSAWAADWVDVDSVSAPGDGTGANIGNIKVESNKLSLTASSGLGTNPSISRFAEFDAFDPTEDVLLNFDYTYSDLNSADEITIEVSDDEGVNWTTLNTYTSISGTNLVSPVSQSLNISNIGGTIDNLASGVTVRISVTTGYILASKFFLDNIEIATGTNACGVGSIGHYAIYIDGTTPANTGPSSTEFNGISCLGSLITIQGHNGANSLVAPGETITLQSSTGKGSWSDYLSVNSLNDTGTNVDGAMQYTFGPTETSATFRFNYTNPAMDNDKVNFNVISANGYPVLASEDPTLNVRLAGLRFFNETGAPPAEGIPNQISSKPSDTGFNAATISLQAVRSSDQDPMQCVPLFDNGTTLDFEFALECVDPLGCAAEEAGDDLDAYVNDQLISRVADNGGDGATAYGAEFAIPLVTQASGAPGGTIKLEYKDAGDVRLNARWEITLDNNPLGLTVGDYLTGDWAFNVRPFGLDIDFSEERFSATVAGGGTDINTLSSFADDANDTVLVTAGVAFPATVSAVGWQAGEDTNDDGIPDDGADLSDNQITRNFGNESTNLEYDVLVTLNRVVAPTDGVGVLTDSRVANFGNGDADMNMIFDEVGIIDLDARLVQNNLTTDDTFMGLNSGDDPGSVLRGAVKNVGRFVPKDFILTMGSITNRSLARIQPSCSVPTSNFTYMGEQFGFSATVTARNGLPSPATTKNYVGAYAKLNGADFPANKFAAVNQLMNNADLSVRLADGPVGANRVVTWGLSPLADGGIATLTGDLVFNRDTGATNDVQPVDGPYTALTLGLLDTLVSTEYTGVTRPFVLDLDRGNDASDDATAIADAEFRYGRLVLENAFGPETEPLEIAFRVEYWDGPTNGFVINSDDSCTTIEFDSATDLSDDPTNENTDERSIRLLDGDNGLIESFQGNLEDGEIEIEPLATEGASQQDIFIGIVNGATAEPLVTPNPIITDFETDRLMEVTAPGDGNDGVAYIEFNLSDPDLGFSLDFLSYDWRTDSTELDDVTADDDYGDNPRARLEFGSYRGHDRVINWQEIYIGPTQ